MPARKQATPDQVASHKKIVDRLIGQREELEEIISKKLQFVSDLHRRLEALERKVDQIDTRLKD
jgi:hypothetical protein